MRRCPSAEPERRQHPWTLTLTEEQQAFAKLAREFLDHEVVPHRAQWDRDESVDTAVIPKMGELGFFGLTIPEEYGGVGGDFLTYCLAMEELGVADSSVRGIVSVTLGLVARRSCPSAPRSRSNSGCSASRPARRWRASGSPSRTPAPTPRTCPPRRFARATTT